jgi:hypothetical protein
MFPVIVSIGTRSAYLLWTEAVMLRKAASTVVLIFTILWVSLFASAAPQESRPKQQSAQKQTAMTGCIDEHESSYVLINDQTRERIANLEAEGFPTEGFAKHLGHKVTVRGAVASQGSQPVFKVRSIETVSETCGPQQP